MYDGNQDIELKEKSLLSTQVSYEFEESGTDDWFNINKIFYH